MSDVTGIPDLWIQELRPLREDGQIRWIGLRDSDHLLRRFGSAEVIRLDPSGVPTLRLRPIADEVWTLLEGEVVFRWHDLRDGSPSRGQRLDRLVRTPTQVLAPFGVGFGVRAIGEAALLLRVCTHADDDPDGGETRTLPWETN
jgi:dTDP-4-dehydrorhamnose 3,5-epimerase